MIEWSIAMIERGCNMYNPPAILLVLFILVMLFSHGVSLGGFRLTYFRATGPVHMQAAHDGERPRVSRIQKLHHALFRLCGVCKIQVRGLELASKNLTTHSVVSVGQHSG